MNRINNISKNSECCSVELLTDYLNGKLDAKKNRIVEEHLIDCEYCSDLVDGLLLLDKPSDITAHTKNINSKLDGIIRKKTVYKQVSKTKYRAVAAVILLLVVFGTALLVNTFSGLNQQKQEKDIAQLSEKEKTLTEEMEDTKSEILKSPSKSEITEPRLEQTYEDEINLKSETTPKEKLQTTEELSSAGAFAGGGETVVASDYDDDYIFEEIIADLKSASESQDEHLASGDVFQDNIAMKTSDSGMAPRRNARHKSESLIVNYAGREETRVSSEISVVKDIGESEAFEELAYLDDIETDSRLDFDSEASESPPTAYVIPTFSSNEEEEQDPIDFAIVEKKPEFPGGETALIKFISENTVYPTAAKEEGIQGRVFVGFVISETGEIKNVRIARGVDPYLDQEALRVVRLLPKWKPGVQRGKNVSVNYILPINFKLSED